MNDACFEPDAIRTSLHLTPLEQHSGLVVGFVDNPVRCPRWPRARVDPEADPRAALELVIRDLLGRGPCVVQFSGGRDSSLILAIAVHIARRDGLSTPRALSVRYADSRPDAHESDWQQLVTDHLAVPLEVITVPPRGNELASPLAVSRLLRDGPVLPPPASPNLGRIAPYVGGATVLTGEGGDNVLGAEKVSRWMAHARLKQLPKGEYLGLMMEDVVPHPIRIRWIRRRLRAARLTPWLHSGPSGRVVDMHAADVAKAPWDWRRSTWNYVNYRSCLGYRTMDEIARREGFTLAHPLLDTRFLEALCRRAGPLGFPNRTHIMRLLAADLLPDILLSRTTKATFNDVYAGDAVRAFAQVWDGTGVDSDLVSIERLRSAWMADVVPAMSLTPLQYALRSALSRGWEPTPVDDPIL